MKIKYLLILFIIFSFITCSTSKEDFSNNNKFKLYLDSMYNKYYYLFDSTRLYVLIPDSISKIKPEFIYEDSKGYPFLSINNEKFEVDIDTTNSLYMVQETKEPTTEINKKESQKKKIVKSKVKKKNTTKTTNKSSKK